MGLVTQSKLGFSKKHLITPFVIFFSFLFFKLGCVFNNIFYILICVMHKLHMVLITVKLITFCTVLVQPCPLIRIPAHFFWCWIIYSRLLKNIYYSRDASLLIYYFELIARCEHGFNPTLVLKSWLHGTEPMTWTAPRYHRIQNIRWKGQLKDHPAQGCGS